MSDNKSTQRYPKRRIKAPVRFSNEFADEIKMQDDKDIVTNNAVLEEDELYESDGWVPEISDDTDFDPDEVEEDYGDEEDDFSDEDEELSDGELESETEESESDDYLSDSMPRKKKNY